MQHLGNVNLVTELQIYCQNYLVYNFIISWLPIMSQLSTQLVCPPLLQIIVNLLQLSYLIDVSWNTICSLIVSALRLLFCLLILGKQYYLEFFRFLFGQCQEAFSLYHAVNFDSFRDITVNWLEFVIALTFAIC